MAQKIELPKAEELLAPFKSLNELAIANAEKLVALQSKNFEKYSKIALSSMKEASEITDLEQSQAFFQKQGELSKKAADDIAADLKEVAEMSQAYASEVQKVVTESISKTAEKAKVA